MPIFFSDQLSDHCKTKEMVKRGFYRGTVYEVLHGSKEQAPLGQNLGQRANLCLNDLSVNGNV